MKTTSSTQTGRTSRAEATARRDRLLAEFERSGLSGAEFVRQHGLQYKTFCRWRQRRSQNQPAPEFVAVEVTAPAAPVELVVEVGTPVRLRIQSESQVELAARLLQRLAAVGSC